MRDTTNNPKCSDWKLVKHSVPQGSILGPLLFLLYINDLTLATGNARPILCADDTSIIIVDPKPAPFVNNAYETYMVLTTWFKVNQLSLNPDKTTFLQFRTKNSQKLELNTSLLKDLIRQKSSIKFLGLFIGETLTWESHITYLSKRLGSACYAIRAIASDLPTYICSFIHSLFTFHRSNLVTDQWI
jgi:hypothetical protein